MSEHKLKRITRKNAMEDIVEGISLYKSWTFMAYQDIISRYRRSIIGPLWVAAMMITQSIALAIVFGAVYGLPIKDFMPHLVSGISIMLYLGVAFNEGTETFSIYKPLVQAAPLPLSFHIFRMCMKNLIVFLHNMVVFFVVYFIFNKSLAITFAIIPAMILSFLFIFGATIFNAVLSLRFRDYRFIIPHMWTILFYLSPVLWKPEQVGAKLNIINHANPAYYFLTVIRSGLEGSQVGLIEWVGALVSTFIALILGYVAFSLTRKQLALWV